MTAIVVRGNANCLPLPDNSVDLICTSPPYFALRSYQDNGAHYQSQIGSEPTPQEFLEALWTCTAEWMRVLKPSGSIFVNLGDKYAQDDERSRNGLGQRDTGFASGAVIDKDTVNLGKGRRGATPRKSLMLLPERYRIGCVDRLGLIARAVMIWNKPNGLPESVTDRVRRSHEDWVHLTLAPRYYSAIDEIREGYAAGNPARSNLAALRNVNPSGQSGAASDAPTENRLGKLPGSVWTVATEPLNVPDHLGVDHFAAFPTEWPRRIIQGWSPAGICVVCDQGRVPVTEKTAMVVKPSARRLEAQSSGNASRTSTSGTMVTPPTATIVGYACGCPTPTAPTRPAVVLDPFGGTGTTALCASVLGRVGISVDLSHDYSRLAAWRTTDPGQRAKAMRVEKPPVQLDGQADLFGGAA